MSKEHRELHSMLRTLLDLADSGASVTVTLNIKGSIVSGELMAEVDFVKSMVEGLAEGLRTRNVENEGVNVADEVLASTKDLLDAKYKRDKSYLFLRNARLLNGGDASSTGSNWCIRVKSVDGFTLSKMTVAL